LFYSCAFVAEKFFSLSLARQIIFLLAILVAGAGGDLRYFEAEGAGHNEKAWSQRIGPVLEYLFGK
jgi:hypothetical protein